MSQLCVSDKKGELVSDLFFQFHKGGALKRLEFSNFALKFGPFFVVVGAPLHCGTANPCF